MPQLLRTSLLIAFTFLVNLHAFGQDETLINPNQTYEINDIKVSGITSYNENTVITYTGLRVGERLYLKGEAGSKISKVIKKLWSLELFSDVNLYVTAIDGDKVDLLLEVSEVPELNNVKITGIKKKKAEPLIKDNGLNRGTKVNENLITTTKNYIEDKYRKKGYLNAKAAIATSAADDSLGKNKVNLLVNIKKGDRVKVSKIDINGNEQLKNSKITAAMKNTKKKRFYRFWKRSKYIAADFDEDKKKIIDKYKSKGFRDARILSDTIIKNNEGDLTLKLDIEEGKKYYFGNIDFIGNSVYSDEQLAVKLGLNKGETYNGVVLKERIADNSKPDAEDLTNLYQNSGYLFSNINVVETAVRNDTIDFEIRIGEGKLAYFNKVNVKGNDKTKDRVIYRMLRTKPGQQYSRQAVMSTIRELGALQFFDPQQLTPEFKNVDAQNGTLDLEYNVVESGASQIELQGGFGGGGFVGTLGLSFNNFSIQNIFKKDSYRPLPMGDGQKFSLRAQASQFFQAYSASFSEPWFGGKKPVSFSMSFSHTVNYSSAFSSNGRAEVDRSRRFLITGGSVGLAKRLEWPDRNFTLSHAISFQHFDLRNFNTGNLFTFGDGASENLAYTIGLSRDNTFNSPIFPIGGSKFSITAKLTPPYSLFNNVDYDDLQNQRAIAVENQDNTEIGIIDQKRFNWLEFYKVKFSGDWYNTLFGKLVLRTNVELGYLGAYNNSRGVPPFERFFLGGDGLGGFALDGREVIRLRGYPNQSITPQNRDNITADSANEGATIFNKFSMELRYPISFNPQATIYALSFIEGGSTYDNFQDYNPFRLNRSAGAGIRIFMPAFGLLGLDFGYGFDPIPGTITPHGWDTHFIIGQQF